MDVGFTIKSYIQKVKEPYKYRPRSGALYVSMRMCHLQVVNSRHFFQFSLTLPHNVTTVTTQESYNSIIATENNSRN